MLLTSADCFQINILFRNTIRVSSWYSLGPEQARHYVGPALGPKCSQRLSDDDTCKQRVEHHYLASI